MPSPSRPAERQATKGRTISDEYRARLAAKYARASSRPDAARLSRADVKKRVGL